MQEKDSEITAIQNRVKEAEQALIKESKVCKQRISEVEQEFADKEKYLKDKLKKEMEQLIKEQIQEIQDMQGDFGNASELMD